MWCNVYGAEAPQNNIAPKKYYVFNKLMDLFGGIVPVTHAYESEGEVTSIVNMVERVISHLVSIIT